MPCINSLNPEWANSDKIKRRTNECCGKISFYFKRNGRRIYFLTTEKNAMKITPCCCWCATCMTPYERVLVHIRHWSQTFETENKSERNSPNDFHNSLKKNIISVQHVLRVCFIVGFYDFYGICVLVGAFICNSVLPNMMCEAPAEPFNAHTMVSAWCSVHPS